MFDPASESARFQRASVQRRRNNEAERRERIFDEKVRTIGIDKQALEEQVRDRRGQEEEERLKQRAWDAETLHNNKLLRTLQNKEAKEKNAIERSIVSFRQRHQQPWNQREFDLNDPDRFKKTNLEDAQVTLPGIVGLDAEFEARQELQKEQCREWLIQQQREQAAKRHQQKMEDEYYDQLRVDMDNNALQLQRLEMETRKAEITAITNYNLSKSKAEEDCRQIQERDRENASVVGVPGLCPSSDRRAPPESLQEVIQFQKYQMEEKKRMEFEKRQEEEQHDRNNLNSAQMALRIERQQAKLNKQLRKHIDSTNNQLAEQQKQKPDIKRGFIYDSFFSQFNTCSR